MYAIPMIINENQARTYILNANNKIKYSTMRDLFADCMIKPASNNMEIKQNPTPSPHKPNMADSWNPISQLYNIASSLTQHVYDPPKNSAEILKNSRYTRRKLPFTKHAECITSLQAGNCEELCILVMDQIYMDYKNYLHEGINAESLTCIYDGNTDYHQRADHDFVVVNRNPNLDINLPGNWGPNTLILDPLFNQVLQVNNIASLNIPTEWYTNNSSHYIKPCPKYDNDYKFRIHYDLQDYAAGRTRPIGFAPFYTAPH